MKNMTFRIDEELLKRIKIYCITKNITVKDFATEAIMNHAAVCGIFNDNKKST